MGGCEGWSRIIMVLNPFNRKSLETDLFFCVNVHI